MKTTLKLTPGKIVLTLALFTITSLFWRQYVIATISDTFPWGFPLQFYLAWGPCPPGKSCSEFNGLWFTLDIIIWYLVSALILSMFKKRRTAD